MGVNTVYRALQELFPQVDDRVLRAVAIEHAKDVDVAAEAVVTEILPLLPEKSKGHSSVDENYAHRSSVVDVRHLPAKTACTNDGNSSEHGSIFTDKEAKGPDASREPLYGAPALLNETAHDSLDFNGSKDNKNQFAELHMAKQTSLSEAFDNNDPELTFDKPFYDASDMPINTELNEGDADVDLWKYHELHGYMDIDTTACASTSTSTATGQVQYDDLMQGKNGNVGEDSHPPLSNLNPDIPFCQQNLPISDGVSELHNILDRKLQISYDASQLLPLLGDDQRHEPLLCLQSEDEKENYTSNLHIPDYGSTVDSCLKQDVQLPVNVDNSPLMNSVVSQSGQVCGIDLLENIIDEAKSHKERLSSALESVTKLMWEAELAGKEAEQAKQDAARGGVDIYARADELKTMLKHAKEANDMHSGEVYGERAILATEVRELQNRLLGLSAERDESLSMLDEMHKTLEARKAAAEQERMEAEKVKLHKETAARDVLAELDMAMNKVVEESRMLDQEAEENEKLREFLVDRGRVVDVLQGEILVICQDVKLLKEKSDNRIPLSSSLSLGYTSCALASSSSASSAKSNSCTESSEHPESNAKAGQEVAMESNATTGQEAPSVKSVSVADDKQLSDDDWELFEAAA